MAFPFMPYGLIVAVIVMGTALALFGLAMWALDRGFSAFTGSILPGVIDGVRGWTIEGGGAAAMVSPGAIAGSGSGPTPGPQPAADAATEAVIEDLLDEPSLDVDHVKAGWR
jgi:hypothetical protein